MSSVISDQSQPDAPLRVVAAVIIDNGLILACRRNPDKAAGGKWEFPGGKVELGENPTDALVREIHEELGVEINVASVLSSNVTSTSARPIELMCFIASLKHKRPTTSSDHDKLVWLPPSELIDLDWAEPDIPAVRLLTSTETP